MISDKFVAVMDANSNIIDQIHNHTAEILCAMKCYIKILIKKQINDREVLILKSNTCLFLINKTLK